MKRKFFTGLLLFMTYSLCHGQNEIIDQQKAYGKPYYTRFNTNSNSAKRLSQSTDIFQSLLKPVKGVEFKLSKTETDAQGMVHKYFKVFYKGISVAGMEYALHAKNDIIYFANGNYIDIDDIPSKPRISQKKALMLALNAVNAKKYLWEDESELNFFRELTGDTKANFMPVGELFIVQDDTKGKPTFKLCYRFEITATEPFSSDFVFIDAISGKLLKKSSKIAHIDDVQTTAPTRYSGTQPIWTNKSSRSTDAHLWVLNPRNVSGCTINTLDYHRGAVYNITEFFDNDNNWTAAEWDNAQKDNIAFDIHWASRVCYDYFKTVHNREGYNQLANAANAVHYKNGPDEARSFYLRTLTTHTGGIFFFGDGDADHNPFGSLDNYAHEYGHGLWDMTIGNVNGGSSVTKEYGAIQEGLSNIWGAVIEHWGAPSKNHWISGEEIVKSGSPFYSLINPNSTGQPDTYLGTNWQNTNCTPDPNSNDNCYVHTNAGVMQYWFYLLCQGGSNQNDLGRLFTVSGIGIDKAAKIVLKAETIYMRSMIIDDGIVFHNTRAAMEQAAIDLYGINSCELASVQSAFYAVNIGGPPVSFTINGPDLVCTNAVFSVNNLPATGNNSIIWSIPSSAGPVMALSQNNPTSGYLTITNQRWYTVSTTLTASVGICGNVYPTVPKSIANDNDNSSTVYANYTQEACNFYNVSHPAESGTYSEPLFLHQGCMAQINVGTLPGKQITLASGSAVPTYWSFSGGILYLQLPYGSGGQPFTFNITGNGACYQKQLVFFSFVNNGKIISTQYTVSPNPASSSVVVSKKLIETESNNSSGITQIIIYDQIGNIKKKERFGNVQKAVLQVGSLSPGVYILEIKNGVASERQQLKIER